jgi:uncharacterized membrane protein
MVQPPDPLKLHRARSPEELDALERRRMQDDTGEEIARRGRPSPVWWMLGIPVVLGGIALVIVTWDWKGGSANDWTGGVGSRYSYHPTQYSLIVIFLGILMILRGTGLKMRP